MKLTASTRAAVEAAIDSSKGSNREPWERYVSRMTGIIVPWRTGSLPIQKRSTRETAPSLPNVEANWNERSLEGEEYNG
jgi:hypothetical protein